MKRSAYLFLALVTASLSPGLAAQALSARSSEADMALLYVSQHGNQTNGAGFFSNGGRMQLTFDSPRHWGAAADLHLLKATNINGSGTNLTTLTTNFGPRYVMRNASGRTAVFAEGLAGVIRGLDGVFPSPTGARRDALALSLQAGGGVDLRRGNFAFRPIQVDWVRTQLPNGSTNVQNHVQFSAGIVFRLSR